MTPAVTVRGLLDARPESVGLSIELLAGAGGLHRQITSPYIQKTGLALAGFMGAGKTTVGQALADKRGIYVGVAADQNYTLAAVAKSEFMLLMDLDWRVTELHRAYEVLIEASEDAKTLHERFHESNADASAKLIEDALRGKVDDGRLKQIVTSWRGARETVYRHLAKVITRTH